MDHFILKAFFEEFPFLSTIGRPKERCEHITVRRATMDLYRRGPKQYKFVGPTANIYEGDEVRLFASCGAQLGQVKVEYNLRDGSAEMSTQRGESILAAISRLGVTEQVHYIVWILFGYKIVNHRSEPAWRATIYKPAKDICPVDLLTEARTIAPKKVKAESDV